MGKLFINSVKSYTYDAADVMDDDDYATLLEDYVTSSSLHVTKVHTKAWWFGSSQEMGYFTQESIEYDLLNNAAWGLHSVASNLIYMVWDKWSSVMVQDITTYFLFQQYGLPPAVICDNDKEMVLGEFNRKLKETLHHLKKTEPFTPWPNSA